MRCVVANSMTRFRFMFVEHIRHEEHGVGPAARHRGKRAGEILRLAHAERLDLHVEELRRLLDLAVAERHARIGAPIAQAEPMQSSEIKTEYQYAAKVVCSLLLPHQDGTLARGTYRTIVNIHNPTNKPVTIAAKVALATDFGSEAGPFSVTPFKKADLQADGAVELSCFNFAGFFCPINGVCIDFAFLEGFTVIKSPVPLDVVEVYTARHTDGEVETMDVETVQPRQMHEMVKLATPETGSEAAKHIEYPPKGSPAYGGKDQTK